MPVITKEFYEANKEEIDRGYLLHRIERWKSSGCVLCWDYCSCSKPFNLDKEEKNLFMMGAN